MDYKSMFSSELIDLAVEASTELEAFEIVAAKLQAKGMVNNYYLEGITKREAEFPTGLITQHLNIALPHSDPEYINQPFVFVCRLNKGIICRQMGDNQELVARDLFFLGIKDGKNQVGLLQAFMDLFMQEDFVRKYQAVSSSEEMYRLFMENI
ncbi:PTS system galactitol-specific IIA component [Enterococcus sp. PF1-24]|uniref:PTS sugar transporter subunit IIA n=1 Tax=unclassified Enterococcus TaxID=2608891 RepID=UPI0024749514|nr:MULTISPECIES: PTS sugar transporter subunit IIA [unclassified Enterococcus]MDH6364844.1 PTS system galactitol-specific IIA component [Enterococcus sp. PFB1-1]MDH6401932.1 PTS system galactitol-specific IIA component [Enterococcus sp. PF1-24]